MMMEYVYVTEDNLENRQNYMYSAFGGKEFLYAYTKSRSDFIERASSQDSILHDTAKDLAEAKDCLEHDVTQGWKVVLENYVKRFEVSKRIYTEYNDKWRAADNAVYDRINLYLLLSDCCLLAYKKTLCTKYLSCMLKVDDTLLSQEKRMTDLEKKRLSILLIAELEFFQKMADSREIRL